MAGFAPRVVVIKMMTVLTIPQFLKIMLWLFVCVMDGDAGPPGGVEFKSLQFCGKISKKFLPF